MKKLYFRLLCCLIMMTAAGHARSFAQEWEQILKTTTGELPGRRKADSQFSRSVAISGSYAIVGAPGEKTDSGETSTGVAYILRNDNGNWNIVKTLGLPSDPSVKRAFGLKVAISGDDVVITASDNQQKYTAFIYSRNQGGNDNWGLVKKISAPNLDVAGSFASEISISGDYLAVASWVELDGSVHIYKRNAGGANNWGYVKQLSAPHSENYQDYFGRSICLSGDRLIVGAPAEDEDLTESNGIDNAGAAYIFRSGKGGADNWGLMAKVIAPVRAIVDGFGHSVSISGDYAIIGCWKEDQDAQETNTIKDAGAAYIFKKESSASDNWVQTQKLTALERKTFESFGRTVAIHGDVAVVTDISSYGQDTGPYFRETGSAHIFKLGVGGTDNWGLVREIEEPVPDFNNHFGEIISLSDQHLFVGAWIDNTDGNGENELNNSGSLYIYRKSQGGAENWGLVRKETRTTSDRKTYDRFGYSVAMDGNYAVVSAPYKDEDETLSDARQNVGAAYVLENQSGKWVMIKKLVAPARESLLFGTAVAIRGETIVIGSRHDTAGSGPGSLSDAGAVYIFSKNTGGVNNWGFKQKIVRSNPAYDDLFGSALSLTDQYLMVGSPNLSGMNSANIYKKDAITNEWNLSGSVFGDMVDDLKFGASVSITNEYASVASGKAIYLYKRGIGGEESWGNVQQIHIPSIENYNYSGGEFELNVTLHGHYLFIGAFRGWDGDPDSGVLLIYSKNQGTDHWSLLKQHKLDPPASSFGVSVSASGDNLLVGALYTPPGPDEPNGSPGYAAAFLYSKNQGGPDNWGLVKRFKAAVRNDGDHFGGSVALNGNYLIVGAAHEDEDGNELNPVENAGAAYIFRKTSGPVTEMEIPTGEGEYQSDYTIRDGNLIHYCTQNYLLLSVEQDGTGASIPADAVSFKIGEGADFFSGTTGFLAKTSGTAVINRFWNVVPQIQPTSDVKVRFYYTTADFEAINAALRANGKTELTSESEMFFYKVKDNSLGEFPDLANIPDDKVQVIVHGNTSSTTTWKSGTEQGNKYAEFLVSSFSGGGAGGTSPTDPLPVTLSRFKAVKKEQHVSLEWETTSETNSDYFEIQRSGDLRNWEEVSRVKAFNEKDRLQDYHATDDRPLPDRSYYRLKIVDLDGSFAYSRALGVNFNGEMSFSIYPNPVADRIFVKGVPMATIRSSELISSSGKTIANFRISPQGIQTTHVPSGNYILKITTSDGTQYHTQVVISH